MLIKLRVSKFENEQVQQRLNASNNKLLCLYIYLACQIALSIFQLSCMPFSPMCVFMYFHVHIDTYMGIIFQSFFLCEHV